MFATSHLSFGKKKKAENQAFAGKPGVIEKIVKIMTKHIGNSVICEESCATLENVMLNR